MGTVGVTIGLQGQLKTSLGRVPRTQIHFQLSSAARTAALDAAVHDQPSLHGPVPGPHVDQKRPDQRLVDGVLALGVDAGCSFGAGVGEEACPNSASRICSCSLLLP